jgi:hypothetical protein
MYNMINHAGTRKRNDRCLKWFVYHGGRGRGRVKIISIVDIQTTVAFKIVVQIELYRAVNNSK